MGNDHSQEIIRCLTVWRTISKRAVAALLHGNIEDVHELIEQSRLIQARLNTYLAGVNRRALDSEARALMAEIHQIQAALQCELQKGASVMGDKIASLRKNTVSMHGYKRPIPAAAPRYLSKRT